MNLKERISYGKLLVVPGCFDVVSAILIEDAGFEAVFVRGYGISASGMGYPDIGLMSMNEVLAVNRHIKASVKIPVIMDIENAYGDTDHLNTLIHAINAMDIYGIQLEDQAYPKSCGHTDKQVTTPTEQYLGKLDTVMKFKHDKMVVVARTDNSDVQQGIARQTAIGMQGPMS
ncbi:hypothetical protein A5320_18105 [Rheinheimera sp. SA_1]|uniref:isocitrate lyase/PEP mutase family protein n=1 Tax=Rheinheimera sp. SA_1 TaxID=1827365 RepID=UPI0007FBD40F|nr:isocitrate lyase/PEP mutase family protein [Rheinheimera sp. SA_1]OBP13466.1 hypothetical protein A5320_18105 [Rheinheimera sp. SA_1]